MRDAALVLPRYVVEFEHFAGQQDRPFGFPGAAALPGLAAALPHALGDDPSDNDDDGTGTQFPSIPTWAKVS